jgi:hypothetical protein
MLKKKEKTPTKPHATHKNGYYYNKKFDKQINLVCAHQRMDDGKLSQKGVVAKKRGTYKA